MPEERYPKRYSTELSVELIGDLIDGKGKVFDLSTGGCGIHTSVPIPMLDTPYLRLLLHHAHGDTLIKVELAAVRWAMDGSFGLEFIRMNAEQQKRLRELIRISELAPTG